MPKRNRPPVSPIDRLLSRVSETQGPLVTLCWTTSYVLTPKGYVYVNGGPRGSRGVMGHRLSYEHFVGPIPEGLIIDHLCRNRGCVNPAHLEPVTVAENNRRGEHPAVIAARTNTCKRGHSLNDAYRLANGGRVCRSCSKLRPVRSGWSRWNARKRAALGVLSQADQQNKGEQDV